MKTNIHFLSHLDRFFQNENFLRTKFIEEIKTHFKLNKFYFPFIYLFIYFENSGICESMWKNIVGPDRRPMTIRPMHSSRSVPKATDTHSEYVILIAFPMQQWLHIHTSVLPYHDALTLEYGTRSTSLNADTFRRFQYEKLDMATNRASISLSPIVFNV